MARVSILTNPNKLIEAKTNLFCDYFIFFSNFLGKMYETELENPLSIVNKVLFQIAKNPHTRKVDYIQKYLTHDYFIKDQFLKQYASYKLLKPLIAEFKNINGDDENDTQKKKMKWLKISKDFELLLNTLKLELEEKMFQNSLDAIITYSLCEHEIKKHANAIKYHTKILVTELLFIGKPLNEIQNIFNRVLSRNIDEFPFPKEVLSKQEKEEFLKGRDFKKQFYGIYNFYNETFKSEFILFKVVGAKLSDKDSFTYNTTQFLSPNNLKLNVIKERVNKYDEIELKRFFSDDDCLIACIPVKIHHNQPYIEEVLTTLRDSINYVSLILDKHLAIIPESYLVTTDFLDCAWKISMNENFKEIKENDLDRLNDNPFEIFKDYKSPALFYFLTFEKIFINAILHNDIEGFWRYLETLFSKRGGPKKVIETVTLLILKNENFIRKMHTRNYIINFSIPWNFDYSKYNLSPSDFLLLRKEVIKNNTRNFYSKIDYPFIKELQKIESKKLTNRRLELLKDYYSKLFLELYENRNSIAHTNNIDEKSYIKLKNTTPNLLIRLRWVLFDLFRKYPNHTFNDIINMEVTN